MSISRNDLINRDPKWLLKWLHELNNVDINNKDFNYWLGFAQIATANAISIDKEGLQISSEERLDWAYVSVFMYDFLIKKIDNTAIDSCEHSAMMLRAAMISRIGAVQGNTVLDPNIIAQWFFERLPFSKEEAINLAEDWINKPIDIIRTLRHIKRRLSVIFHLSQAGYFQDCHELQEWLQIMDKLP